MANKILVAVFSAVAAAATLMVLFRMMKTDFCLMT